MGAWVVGHNMAGYLPESDTYALESWDDAWSTFVSDAQDYADADDDGNDDDTGSMRAAVDAMTNRTNGENEIVEGGPFGIWVYDSIGRPIVFWLAWEDTRTPNDHEEG